MALSQKNSNVGKYIAHHSSMCPVLVTGLGGLYSLLPNTIEIASPDWHRITPDDVAEIPELTLFMNALEFCNAVVQVAHELIQQQLLEYMYQGFIVPVLGPALLQVCYFCVVGYCSLLFVDLARSFVCSFVFPMVVMEISSYYFICVLIVLNVFCITNHD